MLRGIRIILIMAIAVLSLNAWPIWAANQSKTPPKKVIHIQHWQTKNGATVYFVQRRELPMVDVRVVFTAGSAYDGKNHGLSELTNSLIGEGAQSETANQIASDFDRLGAQFATSAGRDQATVALRVLSNKKYLQPALKTFVKVLSEANFPTKAIRRIKNQTLAAISAGQQTPGGVAEKAFYQAVFSGQPYAHSPLGSAKTVAAIDKNKIVEFYHRYYVAKNADIVLVGHLTRRQAVGIANEIVDGLPTGAAAKRLKLAPHLKAPVVQHINFPSRQTAILIGQVGITRKNPNYFPLIVGNAILGGFPTTSILFQQVREQRGLAYYAYSFFRPLRYRGPFMISLKTKVSKTKLALSVVDTIVKNYLKQGPSAEQLKEAKQNIIGSFPLTLASNKNIVAVLTNIAFYHRPLDYLDTYRSKIRAVTVLQIKEAFDREIHLNKLVTITVGPIKVDNHGRKPQK